MAGLTLGFFAFTSCGISGTKLDNQRISAQLQQSFTTGAVLQYGDIIAHAQLTNQGGYNVSFTSPASLEGISFDFYDGTTTINYKELKFPLGGSGANGAVASMIVKAINNAASQQGVEISLEDGIVTVAGSISQGSFYLSINPEDGSFLSLEIPEEELYITFNNFTLLA